MAAPIVVELAASDAVDPGLSRALRRCVHGRGRAGAGCVAEGDASERSSSARGRLVLERPTPGVRIEVLTPIADGSPRSREVSFRDDDPMIERFRAAGLIVAGLVSDLTTGVHAEPATPPAPSAAPEAVSTGVPPGSAVVVRLAGETGGNSTRPWAGAELGADLTVTGPAFVALSGSYDQTWARDLRGIAAQRAALGVGAGVAIALADRLEMRVRLELDMQELRASIVQPSTLLEDSAGRMLWGVDAGADLVFPLTGGLGMFGGGRADWWGGQTTVRVQSSPAETLDAWMLSVSLGLYVRLR